MGTKSESTPPQRYFLESLSDRDRLYLMFDLLHRSFLEDVRQALELAGMPCDAETEFQLLDGACGEGLHAAELARNHPRARIVAFDRDEEAIHTAELAFAGLSNLHFLLHDAEAPLPSAIGSGFDVAQLRFCLTHLRDPLGALGHVRDALRPGGVVYLIDPRGDVFDCDHPSLRVLNDLIIESWARFGTSSAGERQAPLLAQAGFEIVQSGPQDHEAGDGSAHARGIRKLLIESARVTRKALVETTKMISGEEFDEHIRRLSEPPGLTGRCRFHVTFARKV